MSGSTRYSPDFHPDCPAYGVSSAHFPEIGIWVCPYCGRCAIEYNDTADGPVLCREATTRLIRSKFSASFRLMGAEVDARHAICIERRFAQLAARIDEPAVESGPFGVDGRCRRYSRGQKASSRGWLAGNRPSSSSPRASGGG